jgi:hypothetical protein
MNPSFLERILVIRGSPAFTFSNARLYRLRSHASYPAPRNIASDNTHRIALCRHNENLKNPLSLLLASFLSAGGFPRYACKPNITAKYITSANAKCFKSDITVVPGIHTKLLGSKTLILKAMVKHAGTAGAGERRLCDYWPAATRCWGRHRSRGRPRSRASESGSRPRRAKGGPLARGGSTVANGDAH